jgi:hypothetical protein
MLELVIAGAAYALDLILSFMTDGYWKTAGSSIAYLYWNRNSGRRWNTKIFPRPSGICGTSWVSAAELYGIQAIECVDDMRIRSCSLASAASSLPAVGARKVSGVWEL